MIPSMTREQKALAIWQSCVTGFLTFTAGIGLTGIVDQKIGAMLALLGAAMNAGTTAYIAAIRPQPAGHGADAPPVSSR